jgi:AcrR family transcriptional regulator
MADAEAKGRPNQRKRTRKDLLEAAARLMKQGRRPSLEEIAEEALVSRATAYRHFPGLETLLLEAALDMAVPTPKQLFEDEPSGDPVLRLDRIDSAMHDMMAANEASLRMLLIHSLQQKLKASEEADGTRQNRRTPLIEAALAPIAGGLDPDEMSALAGALALIIGTEAMIVFKDVLQVDEAEARRVTRWAIRALVGAARRSPANGRG